MPKEQNKPAMWWMVSGPVSKLNEVTLKDGIKYIKGQQEIGKNGTERNPDGYHHWQLVVCLSSKQRLTGIKKLFPKEFHLEPTRSAAALDYVFKEDTRVEGTQIELGTPPFKRNSRVDWAQQKQLAIEGKLDEIEPQIFINNYRTLKQIRGDYATLQPRGEVKTMVFWGVSDSGKSRRAKIESGYQDADGNLLYENHRDIYVKTSSHKWWDGYNGQKKVIMDEFDGSIGINYLKVWTDPTGPPCSVETKGGVVPLLANQFWIISNKDWRDWYPDASKVDKQACRRRWRIHQFTMPWKSGGPSVEEDDVIE